MATVTFHDAMPQGRRIEDFFTSIDSVVSVTPTELTFQIRDDDGGLIDITYSGIGLSEASGDVSGIHIRKNGFTWLTYTAAGIGFSYHDLQTFSASGAAAASAVMAGADTIVGSSHGDAMDGDDGDDTLDGGAGEDSMAGGRGDDVYFVDLRQDRVAEQPGQGYDIVHTSVGYALDYNAEVEELRAMPGAWALELTGSGTSNRIVGTAGNDTLNGAGGIDTLIGGAGDDIYIVNSPYDVLVEDAFGGYDTVFARTDYALAANLEALKASADTAAFWLTGNDLDNEIVGNAGANALQGLAGNDRLYGDGGDDLLYGGDGADILFGGLGNDYLAGGSGNDDLFADVGNDFLSGEDGDDRLFGGTGHDRLYGDNGNDILYGDTGNDRLYGGAGNDLLYGGLGNNWLYGDTGYDWLYGSINSDRLYGGADNDRLFGDAGRDTLDGGLGNDQLSGGRDADTFVFSTRLHKTKNVDRITDFSVVQDRISLDDAVFKKIGKRGRLKEDAIHIGPKAADAEDRIIYNSKNGTLYFDKDGTGPSSQVRFAILKRGLDLDHKDFWII